MSAFWLDPAFRRHPKTRKLRRLLGDDPHAHHYLVDLWCALEDDHSLGQWSVAHQGVIDDAMTASDAVADFEELAGWKGARGVFFRATVESGNTDLTDDGFEVHGWGERRASFYEKRRRWAANSKAYRERKAARKAAEPSSMTRHSSSPKINDPGGGGDEGATVLSTGQPFFLSPPPPSLSAHDLEGGVRRLPQRVAARTSRATQATLDREEHQKGIKLVIDGMLHSDRSAEVSPSLALGYWEGLRSTHPWRGKDDTDDPLGAIERFEREHGLTALHLRAMKFYLEEEGKKAISNPIRPLHTLLVERVFEQRLVEARRWFDERERALEVRL